MQILIIFNLQDMRQLKYHKGHPLSSAASGKLLLAQQLRGSLWNEVSAEAMHISILHTATYISFSSSCATSHLLAWGIPIAFLAFWGLLSAEKSAQREPSYQMGLIKCSQGPCPPIGPMFDTSSLKPSLSSRFTNSTNCSISSICPLPVFLLILEILMRPQNPLPRKKNQTINS